MSETLLHLAPPKTTNFTHGEPGYPKPTTLQKKTFCPFKKNATDKKGVFCHWSC